jgi:ribonuclease VapC
MVRPLALQCAAALQSEDTILISAGTLTETLIVGVGRNVFAEVVDLIEGLPIEVIPLTAAGAQRIGDVYRQWGRGFHRASLNFGDCFAYEVAKEHNCPLLYLGDDFAQTDIRGVL